MKFKNKDFVHLHCHGESSKFDGLAKLYNFVMKAREMGFPAIALTDHGNVQSSIKFLKLARATVDKKGKDISYPPIKAIIGSEMYLSRQMDIGQNDVKLKKQGVSKKLQPEGRKGNKHLILLAKNFQGYKNLCTLSHKSWTEGFYFDPRIDIEILEKYSQGIICSSACLSSLININLLYGRYDKAKKICTLFKDIFNEDFFLEVMYHGIPEQKAIIPDIFKLGKELDILVCSTNDIHYLEKSHAPSQEVLMAMSQSRCMKDEKRLKHQYPEFYLKSADEMGKIFKNKQNCMTNTVAIAERINTDDIEKNLFGGMRLPIFDVPEKYKNSYDYVCKLANEGLKKEGWNKSEKHIKALKMELEDVKVARDNNNYDFSTYFLIVRDYIQEAKRRDILVGPGRGSGYSSVLLRCLGITYGMDPIKYGLLWSRFLGFQNSKFIKLSDFGFKKLDKRIDSNDLDKDRVIEDDLGGVDRY